MTHDFAKKQQPKKKPSTSNKKAAPKSQVPGWVWLFTGIVTGLFISFLAHLAGVTPEPAPEQLKAKVEEAKSEAKKSITTKFDFYTLLPEREVIVPTEEENIPAAQREKIIYILQAGSFKQAEDADRLRARLILMGLEARVEQVATGNGTWHRVQVGPFHERSSLSKARGILINEGIDTLLLKRKADA